MTTTIERTKRPAKSIKGSDIAYRQDQNQNQDQGFTTNQMPWSRVGVRLDNPQTAEEAIKLAGLDWEVESKPVFIGGPVSGFESIPNKQAIVRKDTGKVFGVFSSSYTPLQNREAFVGLVDQIVGEGQAIYHTAGSLNGGTKIFLLAQIPGDFVVPGTKDEMERYLMMSNSHDGSLAVSLKWVTLRKVCFNTLTSIKGVDGFRSEHQGNITGRINQARDILGLADQHFEWMMKNLEQLAATKINQEQLDVFLWDLYQLDPELPLTDQFHLKQLNYNQTLELFETGLGNDQKGVKGTCWAALNAVTEFVDHYRPIGSNQASLHDDKFQDKRLQSAWFGPGEKVKQQAMQKLLVGVN